VPSKLKTRNGSFLRFRRLELVLNDLICVCFPPVTLGVYGILETDRFVLHWVHLPTAGAPLARTNASSPEAYPHEK
jgi:hypothetical protein